MISHPLPIKIMDTIKLKENISGIRPVIVDFWAPWCAPCRMTKPILVKIALEFEGQVDFLSVNADETTGILESYQIKGIPTVLAFYGSAEVGRVTGARSEAEYRSMFEALASGQQVKVTLSQFDRALRLGTGILFMGIGAVTGYWLVVAFGVAIAFFGVYDHCPIWATLTKRKHNNNP